MLKSSDNAKKNKYEVLSQITDLLTRDKERIESAIEEIKNSNPSPPAILIVKEIYNNARADQIGWLEGYQTLIKFGKDKGNFLSTKGPEYDSKITPAIEKIVKIAYTPQLPSKGVLSILISPTDLTTLFSALSGILKIIKELWATHDENENKKKEEMIKELEKLKWNSFNQIGSPTKISNKKRDK